MKYGARTAAAIGKHKLNFNFDSWGGYQENKRNLLKVLSEAKNAVIYGGDSHNAWAGARGGRRQRGEGAARAPFAAVRQRGRQVVDRHRLDCRSLAGVESLNGKAVAAEFDGAAVTSAGFESYFGYIPPKLMAAAMVANNAPYGMRYAEMNNKGFMLATLTHKVHRLEYHMVSTVTTQKYTTFCDAAFTYHAGNKASFRPSTCAA